MWALDFGAMAWIGTMGVWASVLIVSVTVGVASWYGLLSPLAAHPPPLTLPPLGPDLPMAVGIFVLSLGGHAALPGIYQSMARPEQFDG